MCLKYAWELIWGTVQDDISPATRYSLLADPLPSPPQSELDNSIVRDTICNHPDLFKIMCNINISRFKCLLRDHPNQPFGQSVILSLTEGFWPWAEQPQDYPTTHYEKQHPPKDELEWKFLISQREKEITSGQFSKLFTDLLPGMYVVPVHVTPKAVDKLHLVVNHSAGEFSINSMIDRQDVAGVKLDGIKTLGDSIRAFRAAHCCDMVYYSIWLFLIQLSSPP